MDMLAQADKKGHLTVAGCKLLRKTLGGSLHSNPLHQRGLARSGVPTEQEIGRLCQHCGEPGNRLDYLRLPFQVIQEGASMPFLASLHRSEYPLLKRKLHIGQAQRIFAGRDRHAGAKKLQFIQLADHSPAIVQFKACCLHLRIEFCPQTCDLLHDTLGDLYQVPLASEHLCQRALGKVGKL